MALPLPADDYPPEMTQHGRPRALSKNEVAALLATLPPIDYDRFRADLDAAIDPYAYDPYERAYSYEGAI